jgi:hypothetical protein
MFWPVLLLVVIGLVNAGCGYLIWRRKVYGLIAGYDPRRPPANPAALARWVGACGIVLGAVCISTGAAVALDPGGSQTIVRTMAALVIGIVAVLFAGSRRAARAPSHSSREANIHE